MGLRENLDALQAGPPYSLAAPLLGDIRKKQLPLDIPSLLQSPGSLSSPCSSCYRPRGKIVGG
jgi:hypothetical protein